MSEAERISRLKDRCENIRSAVAVSAGPDVAHCAYMAAWGITAEHLLKDQLEAIIRHPDKLKEFQQDTHELLQAYFEEVCAHLKVDPRIALAYTHSFKQVMLDILTDRG